MEEILNLKNVTYSYFAKNCETLAVKDLNFKIYKGEFISIVGPSGCGKTTILSIIDGLIQAKQGEVLFGNQKVQKADKNIGYMLQKDELFAWRNVEKNVFLPLEIRRCNNKENRKNAISLLEKYGLKDFRKSYPSELSGGMRQRVALIRTLSIKPELLLLDEPFSALDFQTRLNVCNDVFNVLLKENKTAILVTHDIAEAISFAERVFVLSKRPATIKKEHNFGYSKDICPIKRRKDSNFGKYFDILWRELNNET